MKFCSKCGKELFDEAVICPGCGCPVDTVKAVKTEPQDYKTVLLHTRTFLIIGIVLLVLGVFAFVANDTLSLLYTVIGEEIHSSILGTRPTISMYYTCDTIGKWTSVIVLFAAEFVFLVPKNKFNAAFKRENADLLAKDKAEYKKLAREKNREMNKEIPCYKICWIMAFATLALFIVSVLVPPLGL